MQGAPCPPAHNSARSFFVLPLVLALLALAAFPILARAESSPGTVYNPAVPTTPTKVNPTKVEKTPSQGTGGKENAPATGSEAEGATKPHEGNSESEENSEGKENSTAGGGSGDKGGHGGKPEGGQAGKSGVGGAKVAEAGSGGAKPSSTGQNASSSGGGSSPLIPILIVVVVLAAISIGIVLYRQRKGAGGSDGRVSSPNAS